jgi:hypothetical protein
MSLAIHGVPRPPPEHDHEAIVGGFPGMLELAAARTDVLLVIDAVNTLQEEVPTASTPRNEACDQVFSGRNANEFSWLPQLLPPRLRVVISCITEDSATLKGLYWRYPALKAPQNVVLLQPLQMPARLEIVNSTLGYRALFLELSLDQLLLQVLAKGAR